MIRFAVMASGTQAAGLLSDATARFAAERGLSLCCEIPAPERAGDTAYDGYFIDLQSAEPDGVALAESIRRKQPHAAIIALTDETHFAVREYDLHAVALLQQPFEYGAFAAAMEMALRATALARQDTLLLPDKKESKTVPVDTILYVERFMGKLKLHTENGTFSVQKERRALLKQLCALHFFACNKKCYVNLRHVTARNGYFVQVGAQQLALEPCREQAFLDALAGAAGDCV